MKQDVGFFDVGGVCPDLVIENGDLKADNGLQTAALISVFSDKRLKFEELPVGESDRKGWWADLISEPVGDEIGSRLWTLARKPGKLINIAIVEMEAILKEAFTWMLLDGVAASVNVTAEIISPREVKGGANIIKPNGDNIPFKFIWDGQRLKLLE